MGGFPPRRKDGGSPRKRAKPPLRDPPKKRSAAALTSGARRLPVGASETDTKELQNMNNLTIIGFVGGNAECHLTHNFAELEP